MARRCPVCYHESRPAIEQALLNGKPKAQVAEQFGFTYTRKRDGRTMGNHKTVQRHLDECMGETYRQAVEAKAVASGEALTARLRYLDDQVNQVLERAQKGVPLFVGDAPLLDEDGRPIMRHDDRIILAAVREARSNVELLAKLAGRVEDNPEDLDTARAHLRSPQARLLLAQLEELAAAQSI